jgi:hypothetical protein
MRLRMIPVLTLTALAVAGPAARTSPAAPVTAARADDLVGVWTGRWTADDGTRGGAVEMILAQEPGLPTVVAQVTFVDGGLADTSRREGRLTRRGLFFDLVGGGALVLTLESGRRLTGEFAGGPDVPTRFGSLELTRRS